MELQIKNKQPIPKLLAATTSAVVLTRSNVSLEASPAIVSTEKMSREIINNPNIICSAPEVFKIFFNFIKKRANCHLLYVDCQSLISIGRRQKTKGLLRNKRKQYSKRR